MHTLNIDPWFVNETKQSRDGRLNAYETLEARKTVLIVIDMQNYFVADGMPACAPEARTIVPNINRLAQAMRTAGGIVIWVQTEARSADPQDWANRKEAMNATAWAKRQALLAKSGEDSPFIPPARYRPKTRSRSNTVSRHSFRIHANSMTSYAGMASTRYSSQAWLPAPVASRRRGTPPCGATARLWSRTATPTTRMRCTITRLASSW